ncbi:MAG: hypothetical protein L3K07_01310 [Thermoplasmata archaeon]|nr:hypothetical protein [Thermoplasmata archaeon]
MYGSGDSPGFSSPSGSTAKTLILIALLLDLLFALAFVFVIGLAFLYTSAVCGAVGGAHCGLSLYAAFFLALGVIAFIWMFLIWSLCYKPVSRGQYAEARGPTLIFAILAFLTLSIITAILLLIAWIKLGDAVNDSRMGGSGGMYAPGMAQPYGAPPPPYPSPAPSPFVTAPGGPAPTYAPAPVPPPPGGPMAPNCPRCGKPATWIPQYQRFYCYSDGQYV